MKYRAVPRIGAQDLPKPPTTRATKNAVERSKPNCPGLRAISNGAKSPPASPPNTADHANAITLAWYTETPTADVPASLTFRHRNHRPHAEFEMLAATAAANRVAMTMIRKVVASASRWWPTVSCRADMPSWPPVTLWKIETVPGTASAAIAVTMAR